MNKIEWRGGTLLAPVPPVLVSCGTMEKSNIITIAWNGILNTIPPIAYISVRPERYSYNIIKESGEFIINLSTAAMIKHVDYCGVYSGNKNDKFQKCNFTKYKSNNVSCPAIGESPLSLECKVRDIVPLGSHHMFTADIVGMLVNENLIDENGKLHLENADLAAFGHGEYYRLGKKIGYFGFSAAKKKKRRS
jgi:Conserved protein/domain typically associated with flavoprotein oxygenases, DIM6/NTAB family